MSKFYELRREKQKQQAADQEKTFDELRQRYTKKTLNAGRITELAKDIDEKKKKYAHVTGLLPMVDQLRHRTDTEITNERNSLNNQLWNNPSLTHHEQEAINHRIRFLDKVLSKQGRERDRLFDMVEKDRDHLLHEIEHLQNEVLRLEGDRRGVGATMTKTGKVLNAPSKISGTSSMEAKIAWQKHVLSHITEIGIFMFGFVLSIIFENFNWALAFLFWAVHNILPAPEAPEDIGAYYMRDFFTALRGSLPGKKYHPHNSMATFRSIFKCTSMVFFWLAIKDSQIPFANVVLIVMAFVFYSTMKVRYNPRSPGEVIESTMRFAFLGVLVIPWLIMYNIFHSWALAFIALAFFGVPPMAAVSKGDEEVISTSHVTHKWLFVLIMAAVGFMVYTDAGWGLDANTALGGWFLYFYIMSFIVGFFSPPESLPTTGALMLAASVIIFGIGPGTQEVGSALLGPWFPTVYQSLSGIFGPANDLFNGVGSGFRTSMLFLTCPTCYAQSIVNGTFQKDPETGLAGAYGVELTDLRLGPIYAEQPFSAIVKVQNKGAFDANNVLVTIKTGLKKPQRTQNVSLSPSSLADVKADLRSFGFVSIPNPPDLNNKAKTVMYCTSDSCIQGMDGSMIASPLEKVDVRQLFFQSTMISCPTIVEYNLLKQFLPLTAVVDYDYRVESTMNIEFVSQEEWDRSIKSGSVITQVKQTSQLTNAPVRLNIDTLEQPIRQGTRYHVGLNLVSAKSGGIITQPVIQLEVPEAMERASTTDAVLKEPSCSPLPDSRDITSKKGESTIYTWKNKNIVFCNFEGFNGFEESSEKTFTIRANASYHFQEQKDFTAGKIEFSATQCCSKSEECQAQQACVDNRCGIGATIDANRILQDMNAKLSTLQTSIASTNAQITAAKSENDATKQTVRDAANALLISVDSAIADATTIIARYEADPTASPSVLTELKNALSAIKTQRDTLATQIAAL